MGLSWWGGIQAQASVEATAFLICVVLVVIGLYLYLGWIMPIQKLGDPKVKSKAPWVIMMLMLGVAPAALVIYNAAKEDSGSAALPQNPGTNI